MQRLDTSFEFTEGVFVKELKNRFLCEVEIDGVSTVCYVPSSCHLSNFLELKNKKVLLISTQTPNSRTRFAIFAVKYRKGYIILNTSMANTAVANSLQNRRFSYLGKRKQYATEHKVNDYKADIYIEESKTIIEVKSIISTKDIGIFPTVFSERTMKQLKLLYGFLKNGYNVCFVIASLNPYLKSIEIKQDTAFYPEFLKCIDAGMTVKAYACKLEDDEVIIKAQLPIKY